MTAAHADYLVHAVADPATDTATELCGPAGTVVLIDGRVVHGSAANDLSRMYPTGA